MRTRRAFLVLLVVAFVVLSLSADRGAAGQRVITGTVVEWQAAELIAVANERMADGQFRGQTFIPSEMLKSIKPIRQGV